MSVRPQELAYRGVVSAVAFLFRVAHVGEGEARRRALTWWTPGTELYRIGEDLLICLPEPYPIRSELAPGLPLLPLAGRPRVFSTVPLSEAEMAHLELPVAAVVLVTGGAARVETLTRDRWVDPALWLDLEHWTSLEATSLGTRVMAVTEAVEPVVFEPRARFAGVPPAHPEMAEVMSALRGERPTQEPSGAAAGLALLGSRLASALNTGAAWLQQVFRPRAGTGNTTGSEQATQQSFGPSGNLPAWLMPLVWLLAVGNLLGEALGRHLGSPSRSGSGGSSSRAPARAAANLPHEPRQSPWRFLKQQIARLVMRSQLGQLLGRRQEQYLARMMELFERGDLNDALRYAIPLGGSSNGPSAPALGVPTPRENLQLNPVLFSSGQAFHAVPELFLELQRLYRAAFERLRDQGRIDEAAFVLAELLHADEEAVAFLERHGRLHLAAEMAEGRKLPPGLVVRQWWLAGERERAVQVARRDQAWADALIRLERSDAEQAQQLRVVWGGLLAASGDYAQAVTVVWPVVEARRLALNWIDQVLAQGGVAAARMLPRKLALSPESASEIRALVSALLEQEGAEGALARRALAEELRAGERTPAARVLARATARALARDIATGEGSSTPEEVSKLVSFSGDGALRADLAALAVSKREPLAEVTEPVVYRMEAGDGGVYPVQDAAYLSSGRCVIALGEAGVRVLSREGKTVVHFDQPAQRLVLSDHEDRVIAVAERGGVYRLAQIDLQERLVRKWCEAELTAFADTFDGSTWLVGTGQDVVSLDALSTGLQALWRTRDVGRVVAVSRRPNRASLLLLKKGNADGLRPADTTKVDWERWSYELPSLTLRHRLPLTWTPEDVAEKHCAVSSAGTTAYLDWLHPDDPAHVALKLLVDGVEVTLDGSAPLSLDPSFSDAFPLRMALSDEWVVVTRQAPEGVECWIASIHQRRVRARVELEGARSVRMRIQPEHLTLCDDRGRILVLELRHGQMIRNLRTR